MVLEVDESDNRLDVVLPSLPVVTNIDNDHLEHYGSMTQLQAAITRFLSSSAFSDDPLSALVGCGDDGRVRTALRDARRKSGLPVLDYGLGSGRKIRAENVRFEGMSCRFDCLGPFGTWADMELSMPGRHNVLNALGAIAVAWRLGVDEQTMRSALACCERVGRRFEVKGVVKGVRVVDDYGHHPAEIAVTVATAKATTPGRVGVLFQPHRYTRTAELMDDFARCFAHGPAERVCVMPVYAASEEPIQGADHGSLVDRIRAEGHDAVSAVADRMEGIACLRNWAEAGDTILVQGAGDVTFATGQLLEAIQRRVDGMPRMAAAAS
jgi:UDP-N-acetylmuramate--alanine ligase